MARFIVNEYQTNPDGQLTYGAGTTEQEARAMFHTKCAAAAVSEIKTHTIVLEDENGFQIAREVFKH
jgi:hypothetical protein